MILNGKVVAITKELTILDLLNERGVNKDRVVVELNKQIIVKEDFTKINLQDDDTIEVISFVGGGWFFGN